MAKRDVWVQVGRKTVSADSIKSFDYSDLHCLLVKVTGEREPLEVRTRVLWSESQYSADHATRYAASTVPEVVARGLLEAVAACAADGGHWLLSFEDNRARTEASWVRSELGRAGLPPQRREYAAPARTAEDDERGGN
ncbi:hypothetical protein [Streptomyces sp. NPDC057694]|uniref:hypothetical protein n=1 Tax=Streptomyces sp. NPDC057694 TaxID=3346216 RepID=UPI0036BD0BE9